MRNLIQKFTPLALFLAFLAIEPQAHTSSGPTCENIFASLQKTSQSHLTQLLQDARNPQTGKTLTLDDWNKLSPFWYQNLNKNSVRDLKAIQELIHSQGGLTTIVDKFEPTSEAQKQKDLLFHGGTHILYLKSIESFSENFSLNVPGVIITPSLPGTEVRLKNLLGELIKNKRFKNPPQLILDEGYGHLEGFLLDRALENKLANEILDGVTPRGKTFSDLVDQQLLDSNTFEKKRKSILTAIDQALKNGTPISQLPELKNDLIQMIESFMAGVKKQFKQGAFIKNFGEFATGDSGLQIRSDHYNSSEITQLFLDKLTATQKSNTPFKDGLQSTELQNLMRATSGETASPFLIKLITDPSRILAQEKVDILKTKQGFPMEFRASIRHGVCMAVWIRHSVFEYYGEYYPAVQNLILKFFENAPPEFKRLSGGFDVIFVQDPLTNKPTPKIIEFNAGPADGFVIPSILPIETNVAKSNLMGKPTPLIAMLNDLHARGPTAELDYLKTLKKGIEIYPKNSIDDLSIEEAFRYFRSQYMKDFDSTPKTSQDGEIILKKMKTLIDPQLQTLEATKEKQEELLEDLNLYLNGANDYILRNISK